MFRRANFRGNLVRWKVFRRTNLGEKCFVGVFVSLKLALPKIVGENVSPKIEKIRGRYLNLDKKTDTETSLRCKIGPLSLSALCFA